jgi:2-polyprenyl-3-methyl-5-hydroxy-6-metoxy-1,4-benzoquinol methylase
LKTPDKRHPATNRLIESLLGEWPDHAAFIERRFGKADVADLEISEQVADLVIRLKDGELAELCADYRWMCGLLMREDVHFRRTGKYRLQTIAQAVDEVYGNAAFMARYLNGLLLSQVMWRNQTSAIGHFAREFIPAQKQGGAYLEIGPGHGIYTYLAANSRRFSSLTGWDISDTSLRETRHALERLGTDTDIRLQSRDIQQPSSTGETFDTIAISEVLEHLENPKQALETLRGVLSPDGRIFINVPVNSPAPDHIYLWETPEDVISDVENCGLKVTSASFEPMTGFDIDAARRNRITISVVLTAIHA